MGYIYKWARLILELNHFIQVNIILSLMFFQIGELGNFFYILKNIPTLSRKLFFCSELNLR